MQLYSKNFKFIVKSLNMLNKKKLLESIQNQKITTKNLSFLEIILKGLNLN